MVKEIHIYDIDGTLVDSTHRYRTVTKPCGALAIDFPYWVQNRHRAMNDSLLPLAEQYQAQRNNPNVWTVLATARAMHQQEWRHVETILKMPDQWISRKEGNMESGATLKIRGLNVMLDALPELKGLPMFFYEDNNDYLDAVCQEFNNCTGIYVPSKQGY